MSKVLFVCVHNSARSQMAEELLRKYGEGNFVVESAGLEPGVLNPLAIEVLKEEGKLSPFVKTNLRSFFIPTTYATSSNAFLAL